MPENTRFSGNINQIELGFVEREATPELLMKLGIQLHLAELSISNIVSILEVFVVKRARSTVLNWVHKADLQPEDGQSPDPVAVDENVIRLNGQQYWLYAALTRKRTNYSIHGLDRLLQPFLLSRSSPRCEKNTTLTMSSETIGF